VLWAIKVYGSSERLTLIHILLLIKCRQTLTTLLHRLPYKIIAEAALGELAALIWVDCGGVII
jgi:hypothetical protein